MTQLSLSLDIITACIAIGGFIALVMELKNLEKTLNENARGSIYDLAAKVKECFIQYPELRKYFFDEVEIDSKAPEYPRVLAIADLYCLYLEQIATQSGSIPEFQKHTWCKYVQDVYHESPVIRTYLNSKKDWYSRELWEAVKK